MGTSGAIKVEKKRATSMEIRNILSFHASMSQRLDLSWRQGTVLMGLPAYPDCASTYWGRIYPEVTSQFYPCVI